MRMRIIIVACENSSPRESLRGNTHLEIQDLDSTVLRNLIGQFKLGKL